MITKVIKVKNVNQQIPFDGDASKQWFVEVVNSNFPAPQIGMIMNGVINLVWEPRCLNCEVEVIFHTEAEAEVAKEAANYRRLALSLASKLPGMAKSITKSLVLMVTFGVILAVVSQFVDTSKFKAWWSSFTIIAVAETTEEAVSGEYAAIITNSHELYDSDAMREISKETGVDVAKDFWYIGNGEFIMRDLVQRKGAVFLTDYDGAEDYCSQFGGIVPTLKMQKTILGRKDLPFVKKRSRDIEWTSTNTGGDDYAINIKDDLPPQEAYFTDNGTLTADEDDIDLAFRCMFTAKNFVEEL